MAKTRELIEELQSVFKGKGIDALMPPIVFAIANNAFDLTLSSLLAIIVSFVIGILRIIKKQTWIYAFGGFLGVVVAAGFAFYADNATNFFLPGIIGSVFTTVATLVTLIIGRPLAAFASHLTRGWPLEWFWRKDVKPAYREVTWMWFLFFLARTLLQIQLFIQNDPTQYVWFNTLLGLPVTIIVLIMSYIYGLWRLHQLKGPGVDEYIAKKDPPFKGQTRGF